MKKYLWAIVAIISVFAGSKADTKLFDFYQGKLPSISLRQKQALDCGIRSYRGTAKQNIKLEECLRYARDITNYPQVDPELLGVTPRRPTEFKTYLNEQKTANHSDTTLIVTSVQTKDSNYIDPALLGDTITLSINPGASNSETILCTGLTTSTRTFSGCTFGYRFDDPLTPVSGNIKGHSPGEPVIISNTDNYLATQYLSLDGTHFITGTNTWFGLLTFGQFPVISSAITPTSSEQFATKRYVDNVSNAGSATSTEAVVGLLRIGNRTQMASGTLIDANNPLALTSQYATSSCDFATSSAIVSRHTGFISGGCIDQSFGHTWTASTSFSASTSFYGRVYFGGNVTTTNATSTGYWNMATSTMTSSSIRQANIVFASTTNLTLGTFDMRTLATNSSTEALESHYHPNQCEVINTSKPISEANRQVIYHSLNVIPSVIRISARSGGLTGVGHSYGVYTSSTFFTRQFSEFWNTLGDGAADAAISTNIIHLEDDTEVLEAAATILTPLTSTQYVNLNWGTNSGNGNARRLFMEICK